MRSASSSAIPSLAWPQRALGVRPALLGLARRVLRDEAEAADVVDECISRLAKVMSEGEPVRGPEAWLRRSVLHLSIDRHRRRERQSRALPRLASEGPPTPDHIAARREQVEWIRERVLALPPRQRDVAILRDLEGRPYDDIARTLGIEASTARAHAHAARETLRKELDRWKRG